MAGLASLSNVGQLAAVRNGGERSDYLTDFEPSFVLGLRGVVSSIANVMYALKNPMFRVRLI